MISFEENYFYTPDKLLLKTPHNMCHGTWLELNKPGETRESICAAGWFVIRTYTDRHAIQLDGMSHSKMMDLHDILSKLPHKDILIIQVSQRLAYQLSTEEFYELDSTEQLWRYKIVGFSI